MTEENGIPTRTDLADIPEQTPEDERKRDEVEECMRDVIDPELGINVVDLGLVYSIWIENGVDAHIEMTLTSPACPLTDVLEDQVQDAVLSSGVVENVVLDWVWMPPWGPNMITEEGREQLRAFGFNDYNQAAFGDFVADFDFDFFDDARNFGRYVHRRFVGFQGNQGIVNGDGVAYVHFNRDNIYIFVSANVGHFQFN